MADSISNYINRLFRDRGLNPTGFGNPSESGDTVYKQRRSAYERNRENFNPDLLEPKDVASECVASLEYEQDSETLTINFQERGSYRYFSFPAWAFNEFNNAGSRGTYFNLYIRNAGYPYERIG